MRADDLTDGIRIIASGSGARLVGRVIVDPEREALLIRLRLPDDPSDVRYAVWVPHVETFASAEAFMISTMKVIDDVVRKATMGRGGVHAWSPYPIGAAQ